MILVELLICLNTIRLHKKKDIGVREFGGPNFISWGGCNNPTRNRNYIN